VLGKRGFIAAAAVRALRKRGIEVVALGREELDLLAPDAAARLSAQLRPSDSLVIVSAHAPVKNNVMLIDNLRMIAPVCEVLTASPLAHVLYASSDAVYKDSALPLSESSCAEPDSLHGVMHVAREKMLAAAYAGPLCVVRPTLVYGPGDPHNGYGPNRFRRDAAAKGEITLFGGGEEHRDHIYIDDVGEIVARCVAQRTAGVVNAATGVVTSFSDIAEQVARLSERDVAIKRAPRSGPMPHGGYRPIDVSALHTAFPDFELTPLASGLAASQRAEGVHA
jgi:nucleoside-diphosphate-sugar epimerase